jgi:uncharacterized protein YdeI (YjbR/CyaY-like superfamily)
MGKKDKRIDAYIAAAADFARPVLKHLRAVVHKACPDVIETIKWSFPNFEYHNAILCSMASFKQHCAFGFWKAPLMDDPSKILVPHGEGGMGNLGPIKSIDDLPSEKILINYIKQAMLLNEKGIKNPAPKKSSAPKTLVIPEYLTKALKKNKDAQATFEEFSYSNKKEYVDWLVEAKTDETRDKRLATTLEWLAEGKVRNWKYLKK